MYQQIRYMQIIMIASIAIFFSLVGIDNILDWQTNWQFIQHVMSMDTTFKDNTLMYRAINHVKVQWFAYLSIIIWELFTAFVCWLAVIIMWRERRSTNALFCNAKAYAMFGLFCGFLLYFIGFIIIGGEWFAMWQSAHWNGQMTAGLFINCFLFVLVFLCVNETTQ